jgi:hypothetical protein
LERADHFQPLDRERPRDGDGLEFLRGQMGLPRVVLAPFAGAHNVLCVRDRSRPVEPLPKGLPDQRSQHRVVAAYTPTYLTEHLSPLLVRISFMQKVPCFHCVGRKGALCEVVQDRWDPVCLGHCNLPTPMGREWFLSGSRAWVRPYGSPRVRVRRHGQTTTGVFRDRDQAGRLLALDRRLMGVIDEDPR